MRAVKKCHAASNACLQLTRVQLSAYVVIVLCTYCMYMRIEMFCMCTCQGLLVQLCFASSYLSKFLIGLCELSIALALCFEQELQEQKMPSLDARTMQTVAEMRALYKKVALCTFASVRTRHSWIGQCP